MTWTLEWSQDALQDFYAVAHWTTAARIDEALHAATGRGELRPGGPYHSRLLVPPYAALVSRDRSRRVITVWRIVRYHP